MTFRVNRRPAGVKALTALFAFGVLASSAAMLTLASPGTPIDSIWRINPRGHDAFMDMGIWAFPLLGVVWLACAATAYGLLMRKQWGYRLAVMLLVINLTADLMALVSGLEFRAVIGIPIGAALLMYLSTHRARMYFFPARSPMRIDVRPLS